MNELIESAGMLGGVKIIWNSACGSCSAK